METTSQFWIYIQYGFMFFAGQLLHLMVVKIPSLRKRSREANKKFSIKEWLAEDWNLIVATNVLGVMFLIGLDELLKWKPEIQNVVKWFFAGIGAFGNSLILQKFSKYEQLLGAVVDIKSNITDKLLGPTENVDELIVKGTVATGTDVTVSPIQTKIDN